MGLLDEAIREHLDLKRRRGADPTEVERSEREALGPVRRSPEPALGDESDLDLDAGPETDSAPGAVYDDGLVGADEPGAAAFAPTGSDAHEPAAGADEPSEPPPARLDHSTLPGPAATDDDEPSWSYDEAAAEPEPEARPLDEAVPPPHRADAMLLDPDADHTTEYDVPAALGAEEPAPAHADEDVLEETPEFLQDTPDHDRLWFEQRPPKDFDFDG